MVASAPKSTGRTERSNGAIAGSVTDPTCAVTSAHVESYVQVDSFMTQPPSGSFISQGIMSTDDGMQSQTWPINGSGGPTGLTNSGHINSSGRGMVRSTSAGSFGSGFNLQTPRTVPRRKLARWNSLDACLAEELESSSVKLNSQGAQQGPRRTMASLREEGNAAEVSNTYVPR
jgi:hypothetical protein